MGKEQVENILKRWEALQSSKPGSGWRDNQKIGWRKGSNGYDKQKAFVKCNRVLRKWGKPSNDNQTHLKRGWIK